MTTEEMMAALAQSALFKDVGDNALRLLAERAASARYGKGQLIFQEGDRAEALFILIEGAVKITVMSLDGEQMVLTTLGPHDIFGELALLDGKPRSATAEVLQDTRVLAITREAFLTVLEKDRRLVETVFQSLGELLRRLTQRAADFVFLDLHGRVAKLLLELGQRRGEVEGENMTLDLQLTQSDIAAMVGGSRQSVNQILRAFEERGYIDITGRHLVIKRPDSLRRRAGLG
jgi:CRP-like cAMP-binding protein